MTADDLLEKAKDEVILAAKELSRQLEAVGRKLTPAEQRLRMAVFMLRKAKGLSGMHSVSRPEPDKGRGG